MVIVKESERMPDRWQCGSCGFVAYFDRPFKLLEGT
jgi:hypothetical protein